jgi:hypothetical protein
MLSDLKHSLRALRRTFVIEGQRPFPESRDFEQNPPANLESVTPGYFGAIGMSVVSGRDFTDMDTLNAPRVTIVSERLARRLWPGQIALSKRILPPGQGLDERTREIGIRVAVGALPRQVTGLAPMVSAVQFWLANSAAGSYSALALEGVAASPFLLPASRSASLRPGASP